MSRSRRIAVRLTAANALDLISRYDIVADGSDNFATRYLVSDACLLRQEAAGDRGGRHLRRHAHHHPGARARRRRQAQPDLSLPVSRAAAAGLGAGLRGGRHPRRAHRRARLDDGAGGDPRDRRLRRGPGRAPADGRRARDALRDAELRVGPGQSAVGRDADDHGFVGARARATCSTPRRWSRPSPPTTCSCRH